SALDWSWRPLEERALRRPAVHEPVCLPFFHIDPAAELLHGAGIVPSVEELEQSAVREVTVPDVEHDAGERVELVLVVWDRDEVGDAVPCALQVLLRPQDREGHGAGGGGRHIASVTIAGGPDAVSTFVSRGTETLELTHENFAIWARQH